MANPLDGRNRQIKHRYGITQENYESLYKFQNGNCALCGLAFHAGRRPAIDHDHKTKRVRGLLHRGCNLLLGFSGDSTERLKQAIAYLHDNS